MAHGPQRAARSRWGVLLSVAACALWAACTPSRAASADAEPPVSVRAVPEKSVVRPGGLLAIAIVLDHSPGWHSWPAKAVTLPPDIAEIAIRTTIAVDAPAHLLQASAIQWPEPHPGKVPDPNTGNPISVPVYSGSAIAFATVRIADNATAGRHTVTIRVGYQSCNEETCLPPEEPQIRVAVTVGDATSVAAASPNEPPLFATYDRAAGERAVSSPQPPPAPADPSAKPGVVLFNILGLRFSIDASGPLGLVLMLLVALLGGFILNFTPCVLPVVPIKILSLTQSAHTAQRRILLGFIMSCGVVAFWLATAAMTIAFKAAAGQLFGIWWFNVFLGLFIAVMGVGMLGLFTIRLPQAVYMFNPAHESPGGSFFFGVLAAVLALPCVAPFAANAMAWAATQPVPTILAIFAAIGIGMASPYFVLTACPALLKWLPRTGPASELIKQAMGLLMLAVAAFFLGGGFIALVAEEPYLGKVLHWWIAAILVIGACAWVVTRTFQITRSLAKRTIFTLLGLALSALAWVVASSLTGIQRHLYDAQLAARARASPTGADHLWADFSQAAFAAARDSGNVVVLDFTAEWCLICKTLKLTVLSRSDVEAALTQPGVSTFLADLTSRKAEGWQALKYMGERGIPLLAIFVPGQKEPIFKSNAYTPSDVIEAINRALQRARPDAPSAPPGR